MVKWNKFDFNLCCSISFSSCWLRNHWTEFELTEITHFTSSETNRLSILINKMLSLIIDVSNCGQNKCGRDFCVVCKQNEDFYYLKINITIKRFQIQIHSNIFSSSSIFCKAMQIRNNQSHSVLRASSTFIPHLPPPPKTFAWMSKNGIIWIQLWFKNKNKKKLSISFHCRISSSKDANSYSGHSENIYTYSSWWFYGLFLRLPFWMKFKFIKSLMVIFYVSFAQSASYTKINILCTSSFVFHSPLPSGFEAYAWDSSIEAILTSFYVFLCFISA